MSAQHSEVMIRAGSRRHRMAMTAAVASFFVFGLVLPLFHVLQGAFHDQSGISLVWFNRILSIQTLFAAFGVWLAAGTVLGAGWFLREKGRERSAAVRHGLLWACLPALIMLFGGSFAWLPVLLALIVGAAFTVTNPLASGRGVEAADMGRGLVWAVGAWTVLTLLGQIDPTTQDQGWLANSLILASTVTVLTTLLAMPLAFFSARYRFRGQSILTTLLLVPLIMPPFVGAIGMQRLLARYGTLNLLLINLGLVDEANPIDILGGSRFWGVVLLEVLHLYPILYLNLTAALANVDPGLEEAGRNLGDTGWRLFRKVTLPLIMPGLFAGGSIVFVWSFTDLGTPLIFGYKEVAATRIFQLLPEASQGSGGRVYALVVLVLALTLLLFYLAKQALGRQSAGMLFKNSRSTPGKEASPAMRGLIYCLFGGVILAAMLPHIGVLLSSVSARWFMTPLPTELTFEHYSMIVDHPLTSGSIARSFGYSLGAVALDLVLGLTIAYYATRGSSRLAQAADAMAMLPLAVPGIVLAFGYMVFYSSFADIWPLTYVSWLVNPVHFPVLLLVMSYAVRRLPFMVRAVHAGFQQVPPTFEEASLNLGATPRTTLRRITLPLIAANVAAGAVLCFSLAMLEVSDSLILAPKSDFYPLTKAIYAAFNWLSIGEHVASALGVIGMGILSLALLLAAGFMGRRLGEMFRVG